MSVSGEDMLSSFSSQMTGLFVTLQRKSVDLAWGPAGKEREREKKCVFR